MPDDPAGTTTPTTDPPSDTNPDLEAARAELDAARAALAAAHQERDQALAGILALTAERDEAQSAITNHQSAILATHRRALLAENRGAVIDELVTGDSAEALDSSVAAAKAAYARVVEAVKTQVPAIVTVPPGASPRSEPAPDELSPLQKITGALTRNGR